MSEALISQRATAKRENHDVNFIIDFFSVSTVCIFVLVFMVMTLAKLSMQNGISYCKKLGMLGVRKPGTSPAW